MKESIVAIKYIEQVFYEYYPRLCDYADRLLNDTELAQDIIQDVFISFCERNTVLPADSLTLKSFLYTAVRNNCLKVHRHAKVVDLFKQRHSSLEFDEPAQLEMMIHSEIMSELYRAIETLPEGCKLIIKKGMTEGASNEKIAQDLNISIHTVKSQKQRAVNLLKQRLGPHMGLLLYLLLK
jgi:RNA polymerase sigma-70 factor (family 1)